MNQRLNAVFHINIQQDNADNDVATFQGEGIRQANRAEIRHTVLSREFRGVNIFYSHLFIFKDIYITAE